MTRGGRPTSSCPAPPHTLLLPLSPEATSMRGKGDSGKGWLAARLSVFTAAGRYLPWSPPFPLPLFGSFSGARAGGIWGPFSLSSPCWVLALTPMLWEASSEALDAGSPVCCWLGPCGVCSRALAAASYSLILGWSGRGPHPLKVAAGQQAGQAFGLRRGSWPRLAGGSACLSRGCSACGPGAPSAGC